MWNRIDNFGKENVADSLDITAFMSLLHVTGYCGDLDGRNEVEPLAWRGGAPMAAGSLVPVQKENAVLRHIADFWKENRRDLAGCAMFSCLMAVVVTVRVMAAI